MIMVKGSPVNWKGGKAQQKTGGRKKRRRGRGDEEDKQCGRTRKGDRTRKQK